VTRADEVASAVREAFLVAKSGRPGPVLIDITKDAQQSSCTFDWDAAAPDDSVNRKMPPMNDENMRQAIALIASARRPLILAGHGILLANATEDLRAFVDATGIPVAVTLLGIGCLPASHPLNLGMMGMHGEAWVNTAIQEADLLIALGMRFDDRVTGNLKTYAQEARKIHVDIDPAEIGKNVPADVGIVADVRDALRAWGPALERLDVSDWVARIDALKGDSAVRDIQNLPDDGHLYAAHVINDLWRATHGQAVVVTDVGQHQMWEAQYYHHELPRTLITSGGLGTMGFALPAAIGAKMACPDAEVWAIVGDGGFQMTMCELATIQQERLKVNIAIINNGYLGMVRQWQQFFHGRRYSATPIWSPDYVALANAYGIHGRRVESGADVYEAVREALERPGPALLEFMIEQEANVFPMIPPGASLSEPIEGEPEPAPPLVPA
jgi:acetolactate synthase-1/2/3 large subunit